MKKIILILILFSVVLLNAKTWVREYTYNASEADSKLTSRAISLEQVKRLLLQEIGVYVHSTILNEEVEVSGELKELTAKQIEIISAGITETKIIEENWNGETYYIKAEITADENDVIKRLDKVIEDKEKTKQLEDSRKKTEVALAEIERLKHQLSQTKDENDKLKIQKEYNESSNALTAEDWFQKGINAYDLGEYDNAILYYQKAININPRYAKAFHNTGISYCSKGFYNKALQKEFYNKALDCLRKAIAIDPKDPKRAISYLVIGLIFTEKKEFEKSIESYNNAIKINPEYAEAYFKMGIAYKSIGNNREEIDCLKKASRLDYKEAQYLLNELGISW